MLTNVGASAVTHRPQQTRSRCAALILAISVITTAGEAQSGASLPFDLTWVEGRCPDCTSSWKLGPTLFTSRNNAWGIGATGPEPGKEGLGYKIVIHTEDGGFLWTPVAQTQSYATAPSISFLNVLMGWIETNTDPSTPSLLHTNDAGKTWKDVTGKLPVFPHILDANHWWGIEEVPRVRGAGGLTWNGTLVRTGDGGRTWTRSPLPDEAGDFPLIRLLSPEVGWVGSVAGDQFRILRTLDGGKTWQKSLATPPRTPTQLVDLFFLDRNRGWLIVDYNLIEGVSGTRSFVFSTADGGRTWVKQISPAFDGEPALCVRFLTADLGFVLMNGSPQPAEADQTAPALAYTTDAGAHWQKVVLRNNVSGCQVLGGDLLCSAQGSTSRLMVLTIHPR